MTDLEAAWSDLHDAAPPGWFVGQASFDERLDAWVQYAAPTEAEVVSEPARCLQEIREGRMPE